MIVIYARGDKGAICNEIYARGEWPDDFLDSVIIPIEEMLIWKRMEKISQLDKVTNVEVLR